MKQLIKRTALMAFASVFMLGTAFAGASGCWQTVDDKTGQKKALVKVSAGQSLSGKIVKTYHLKNDVCTTCKGKYKNKKLTGLTILSGFSRKSQNEWTGGKILDPKSGKYYTSTAKLMGNKLRVRGYWGPFYRTQTWYKASCR